MFGVGVIQFFYVIVMNFFKLQFSEFLFLSFQFNILWDVAVLIKIPDSVKSKGFFFFLIFIKKCKTHFEYKVF